MQMVVCSPVFIMNLKQELESFVRIANPNEPGAGLYGVLVSHGLNPVGDGML